MKPDRRRRSPALPSGRLRQVLPAVAAVAGLLVYFVLFYRTTLLSAGNTLSQSLSRADLLRMAVDDLPHPAWAEGASWWSLVDRLPVLGLAAAVLTVATAAGWLLLRMVRAEAGLTPLEQLVFSATVGINAVSTSVLGIGLCGGLRQRWLFLLGSGVVLIVVAWRWWSLRRNEPLHPQPLSRQGRGVKWGARWLWTALPFAVVLILGAMLPPVDFDVREYHLQAPKEFYQAGYIGFVPHNVYANMPLGAEMLSLLAMILAGDWWLGALAGKTAIALTTLLAALGVFAFGRRWFSPGAGAIGAVAYLSIPWIVDVSMSGLIDAAAGSYWLLAFAATILWREARDSTASPNSHLPSPDTQAPSPALPRLLLAGYLAGAAVACKYPGLLFVCLPLAAAVAWRAWHGRAAGLAARLRATGRAVMIFAIAAAVGCGLWLGKNAVLTGNPTYPLLYNALDGRTRSPEKDAQWNRVHRPHDFSAGAVAVDAHRVLLGSPWLSPLIMPLAALALVRPGRRVVVAGLLLLAWIFAMWWLLTHRIDRFWIPILPVLALLAGRGAIAWSHRLWRLALAAFLVFGLAANLLVATCGVLPTESRLFMPLAELRDDPQRVGRWRLWLNEHVTHGKLLAVGDAQVFDYRMPVLYSTCFDTSPWEEMARGRTPAEIHAALWEQDVTYVYVDWGEIARYRRPGNYGFTEFIQPEMFESLVRSHVLAPLPPLDGLPGRDYRVLPRRSDLAPVGGVP